jgi:hypothetical protein
LSSKAIGNTEFYNTTVTSQNLFDSIYGMFMCRGDVSSQLCHKCIRNATQTLSLNCPLSKRAVTWYAECMVRYSNNSFFSTVSTSPGFAMLNTVNISHAKSFMHLLFLTLNQTADEAAHPLTSRGDNNKKFATRSVPVSQNQTLYCLAQCTPDLSPYDCRTCLDTAIRWLPNCCDGKQGGRVIFPSCNVRYELYPFYRNRTTNVSSTPNQLVPQTMYSKQDSRFSQDPFYLSYNCSSKRGTFDDQNFKLLLSYLYSNSTNGKKFYRTKEKEIVYGFFLC